MSEMQRQAVELIRGLSEDNLRFLLEIIRRLMPEQPWTREEHPACDETALRAFQRLDAARAEIKAYLPDHFDPEQELEEARAEKYGCID